MAKSLKRKKAKTSAVVTQKSALAKSSSLAPEIIPSVVEGGSALQNYMARISKIPLLTKEEEYKLTVAYFETKDPVAGKKLIQSNLRFVVKVAAEYSKFSSKIMDLIQEGNIGLIRAAREFNPYKGARLITYAVWWIRGYIQEYLMRHHSIVRLGANKKQQRLFYLLQKEKQKLEGYAQGRLLPALAKQTQTKTQDVEKMKEVVLRRDLSLDQPISQESEKTFLDLHKDPSSFSVYEDLSQEQMSQLLKSQLKNMEKDFNEKENKIIQDRLLKEPPRTLQEIADDFNVTREAIRQNEERLMKKLKERLAPIFKKPY